MGIFDFLKPKQINTVPKKSHLINKEQPENPTDHPDSKYKIDLDERLKRYRRESKRQIEAGIVPEPINSVIGYVIQHNAIVDYKNKDFESAKNGLLLAIEKYEFYSPGGVDYLAKIYRKEKDYQSEIKIIEQGLAYFESNPETNWSVSKIATLNKRLAKAEELNEK
ncbi:hypothetical protein ACJBY2_10610 [Streptococcus suis]|uniref:hypothetical protein n=1 Tax=Streptococcus suis TaxID=1307 RepID=UPI00201A6D2A|nr:hypothetical protein [Streptococcus suis]MCL4882618.1 hypothetical protein [Streptococcus suis]